MSIVTRKPGEFVPLFRQIRRLKDIQRSRCASILGYRHSVRRPVAIIRDGRAVPLPLPIEEPDLTFDEMVELRKDELIAERLEDAEIAAKFWRDEMRSSLIALTILIAAIYFFFG